MYPEQLLVEPGGSKLVNCSTSCAQPEAGGLETALTKSLLQSGPQWNQYLVSNISQDTVIYCYFTCFGDQKLKSLDVSVFCECRPAGPSSLGQSPCLLILQSYSVTAPGHSLWSPPPWAPGVMRSRTPAMGSESAHTLHWPP